MQYTAAVRELDHRERECAAILRPLKELEARLGAQEGELATLRAEEATARGQFDELHQIFLSDHETQVAARLDLTAKRSRLEGEMAAQELARFMKILQQRQGRAVVPVENGICTGCRTKLRIPIMTSLREAKLPQPCESCQRFLYLP